MQSQTHGCILAGKIFKVSCTTFVRNTKNFKEVARKATTFKIQSRLRIKPELENNPDVQQN